MVFEKQAHQSLRRSSASRNVADMFKELTEPASEHLDVTPYFPTYGKYTGEFEQSISRRLFCSAIADDSYNPNIEQVDEELE